MKSDLIWVKIETKSYYNLLIKLSDIGINIYDNKIINDNVLIKISSKDYEKINKYLVSYNKNIESYTGYKRLKELFKKYFVFIITSLIGVVFLLLMNNIIFKIDIKTSNEKTKSLILNELKKYNIDTLSLKKRHKDIEKLVSSILDNNKDTLEWLEIKYDGLIMIVNVVEKTKEKLNNEDKHCNIVAKTDAKIISMNVYRGVALKEINDYVYKDDILISGDIIHNEEIKNTVCASGIIYGEVWYKVSVKLPLKEEFIEYTGKNRYNIGLVNNNKKYLLFKSRLKEREEEITNLYKLNNFEINLIKEKEYVKKYRLLSEEEATNKAISKGLENIKLKLNANEDILLQKVLKKNVFDSTIYLELFVVTKEEIGYTQVLEEELTSDGESSNKSIS